MPRCVVCQPEAPNERQGRVEMAAFYLVVLVYVAGGAWTWWQLVQAVLD